jgi:hypothetical protein
MRLPLLALPSAAWSCEALLTRIVRPLTWASPEPDYAQESAGGGDCGSETGLEVPEVEVEPPETPFARSRV